MSLASNVNTLAMRVATESKSLRTLLNGNALDNSALVTTAKSNLVAAINEVADAVSGASGIDDGTISTTSTWSSDKIDSEISDAVSGFTEIDDTTASTSSVYSSTKTNTQISTAVAGVINNAVTATGTTWSSTKIASEISTAVDTKPDIDDVTASGTSVYSSSKTDDQISAAILALVDGADPALDTLRELAELLSDDADAIAVITTALDSRVRTDTAAQGLNSTQQGNARTNIGAASAADLTTLSGNVGDTTTNFVTTFESGL